MSNVLTDKPPSHVFYGVGEININVSKILAVLNCSTIHLDIITDDMPYISINLGARCPISRTVPRRAQPSGGSRLGPGGTGPSKSCPGPPNFSK